MIDGLEHDGNSGRRRLVESSPSTFILCHVGSHVPTLSLNTRARSGHFHDVIHAIFSGAIAAGLTTELSRSAGF